MQIGDWGHLSVIISFLTAIVGAVTYYLSVKSPDEWKGFSRGVFAVHTLSVFAIVGILFSIIYTHNYHYHYAWDHASNDLPWYYMLSCFWEGQEGSFLLWIFWNVILGTALVFTSKKWEIKVMVIFFLGQIFLISMVLGIVPFGDFKIGSSPFVLLKDVFPSAAVFQDPDFIPENGNGLNPLLQNYWMVIHPPTLFLGFALTFVPYAFVIAGLWDNKFTEWLKPALPWTIFGSAVLGLGILMGGYWAYETLNFGGYWNWDPVENAVFIPWIVQIGALHIMVLYRRTQSGIYWAMGLVMATFILILYSTFLTRSGVLGEASVHSFTDLGLTGQLLLYLIFYIVVSVVFIVVKRKKIPVTEKEISVYSIEFWVFLGVIVLMLSSFQILFTTSLPVINKVFGTHLAPPIDAQAHYSKWQIWFAIVFSFVAGTAQFYWWNTKEKVFSKKGLSLFTLVIAIVLLVSTISIFYFEYTNGVIDRKNHGLEVSISSAGLAQQLITYVLLLAASFYVIISSFLILRGLWKQKVSLSGGAISHIGFAMMLMGILFSSGYSKVVSLNSTAKVINPEFSEEMNTENVFLRANETNFMNEYQLSFKGKRVECDDCPTYVDVSQLFPTGDEKIYLAKSDFIYQGKVFKKKGDTVQISPENTFFEVQYKDRGGEEFTLFPRAQINPAMGGLLASPDLKRSLTKDLYTHVSSVPNPSSIEWGETKEIIVKKDSMFFLNGIPASLDSIKREIDMVGLEIDSNDLVVMAYISLHNKSNIEILQPSIVFSKKIGKPLQVFDVNYNAGVIIDLANINQKTGEFTFNYKTTEHDYIILKAIEKPLINILWIGTLVLMLGFGIASYRRYKEFRTIE